MELDELTAKTLKELREENASLRRTIDTLESSAMIEWHKKRLLINRKDSALRLAFKLIDCKCWFKCFDWHWRACPRNIIVQAISTSLNLYDDRP